MNKKIKRSILGVVIASSIAVAPMSTAIYASDNVNSVVADNMMKGSLLQQNLENLSEMTTKYEVELKHITATYKLDIYVSKYGEIIEKIIDKTTDIPGWTGNVWNGFKSEGGLEKYMGKTFAEIKNMPKPDGITVMGGTDKTPEKIHGEILKLIQKLEKEDNAKEKLDKADLAKTIYENRKLYEQKDSDEYYKPTMDEFVEKYDNALSVLKNSKATKDVIDSAISELTNAAESMIYAPVDWTRYKNLEKQAQDIIGKEQEYTMTSIVHLKQVLKEVQDEINKGGNKKSKVKVLEDKLDKYVKSAIKKSEAGNRFTVNAKIVQAGDINSQSMSNMFMKQEVLLIEKDGKNEYQLFFKKGVFAGVVADILTVKHIENGKEIQAEESSSIGEYNKVFTIKREKSGENSINILLGAKMAGPEISEMPAVVLLDTTSKRPEGEALEETKKENLKKVIDSNKATYEEVLAGEYKESGSKTYLEIYDKAIRVYDDKSATQETVDKAEKSLKSAKDNNLVPKKVDDFGRVLSEAEKKKEKDYTKESYQELKVVIDEGNANWGKRFEMTNAQLQELIDKIQKALNELKPNETPDKKEQLEDTLDQELKPEETPDKKEQLEDTLDQELKPEETPDKKEQLEDTLDQELKPEETPDKEEQLEDTLDQELKPEETPDKEEQLEETLDQEQQLKDTLDQELKLEQTPDKEEQLEDTLDQELKPEETPDKEEQLEDTLDQEQQLKDTLDQELKLEETLNKEEQPEETPEKEEKPEQNSVLPKTGDCNSLMQYLSVLGIAMSSIALMILKKLRKTK